MAHTVKKTMGLALAGLLLMAPVGIAAGTSTEKSPGPRSAQMQQPTPSMPRGPVDQRASGTVEEVDQRTGLLTLRLDEGNRIQLKLPKQALSNLNEGDRVHVAIMKE
jgi:hypothetical protein